MAIEKVTLGGGCFWCIDGAFRKLKGVKSVVSGYSGGELDNPTYKDICTGQTGHAEVVQIEFDTAVIDLVTLLKVFFTIHDPTTLNRQGADIGTQYRSVIFYGDAVQQQVSEQLIKELNEGGYWPEPIVTEVSSLSTFYDAELYHQNYYELNSSERYCQLVIQPKLNKLMDQCSDLLL